MNNIEEMPYYELVNKIMQCTRRLKQPHDGQAPYWKEVKLQLEEEQTRRINSLCK